MIREPLIFAATADVAGKVRGKAFPATDLEMRLRRGVGWTPTNVQITCFDAIAESPYGALGDLLLVPDADAEVRVDFDDGAPPEHFMLGDIKHLDGTPWECCTRSMLRAALARLERVAGLRIHCAFEHEFQLPDAARPLGDGYSLAGYRAKAAFLQTLMSALGAGGMQTDTVMKEYGVDQYEVTVRPVDGLRAADHAAALREITRATAARHGERASFTPLRDPAGVGNGVHVHISLRDTHGAPATHDANGPHGMSAVTGSFIAGVLKYLDAILALTAPSVVSYTRLTPHRWSAAYNNLGAQDREASVRLCPVTSADEDSIAAQYNFEIRAVDAAASPHLALAAIVHAGVQGLEETLPAPTVTAEDLSLLDTAALDARGLHRLPLTLQAALDRFAGNEVVTGWFPGRFPQVYRLHKQAEMAYLADRSDAEICELYGNAY